MQGFHLGNLLSLFSSPKQFARETGESYLSMEEFDQLAVVDEQIDPYQRGRVRYRGSYWFATSEQDICILPETPVLVVGRESLTLVVKTLPSPQKTAAACP